MQLRKLLAGAVTTVVALSTVALTAGPAFAVYTQDPNDTTFTAAATDLVGVGSDTSQHAMKLLADGYNAQVPAPTNKVATFAALSPACPNPPTAGCGGTIPIPNGEINRPNGSGAGKALLHGAGNDLDVDYARSSSAQNAAETSAGLQSFPFALDTLVMAVSGSTPSNAPTALTTAQIVDIYECDLPNDNWSDVGGTAGVIAPKIPQGGSGTRSFFVAQLKIMNAGVDVTLGGCVAEVQEHSDTDIKNDANAIAPFSKGRAELLGTTLRLETGFSADRALYNVVRGDDLSNPDVQAVFGSDGYVCSTEARDLIEAAGFKQLATPANGGVCGAPTQAATSIFVLNEQVLTSTALTVTSAAAGKATLRAVVTGSSSPQGTVTFSKGATVLQSGVPLTSGQAQRTFSSALGSQTFHAEFVPDAGFEPSEDDGTGTVKTSSKITESYPRKTDPGKRAKGMVTVDLVGLSAHPAGTVTIKEGSRTLKSKALSGGKATIKLPLLTLGVHNLKAIWNGSAIALGSVLAFTVKQK